MIIVPPVVTYVLNSHENISNINNMNVCIIMYQSLHGKLINFPVILIEI